MRNIKFYVMSQMGFLHKLLEMSWSIFPSSVSLRFPSVRHRMGIIYDFFLNFNFYCSDIYLTLLVDIINNVIIT